MRDKLGSVFASVSAREDQDLVDLHAHLSKIEKQLRAAEKFSERQVHAAELHAQAALHSATRGMSDEELQLESKLKASASAAERVLATKERGLEAKLGALVFCNGFLFLFRALHSQLHIRVFT